MKKINNFIAILFAICVSFSAFAYDFHVDGIYYTYYSDGTSVSVTNNGGNNSYSGDVIIPATVTYLGTTYSVTTIWYYAFSGCTGLTRVTIGNSVTSIGDNAFGGCTGLTTIDIPNSVTYIGGNAFYGCIGLTRVTIGNSVTSIGDNAFYGCIGLTSITIPNSVTTIGDNAFSGTGLTSITIPNSVTTIGRDAFFDCTGLTSIIVDSDNSNYSSEDGVLYNKDKTTLIFCPGGKVGNVTIPNSVTTIDNDAFYGCSGLTSITIPNSVTTIGYDAFYGCSGLTSIVVDNDNSEYSSEEGILYNKNKTTLIVCPPGKTGNITIPNSVTTIDNDAFYGCSGLTSITIPNSVTYIGDYAFSGCTSLDTLNYNADSCSGDGFMYSSFNWLSGCDNLEIVNIGNNVKVIPNRFIKGKTKVKSITIGNSVKTIRDSAFSGCTGLTTIDIPNSVTSIGSGAFAGCSSLTRVTIGNSVTSIGRGAFYGCIGLTSITIPNSVTTIGDNAFSGCTGLTRVTIGNSVTSIGSGAFAGCSSLTRVTIGNSVASIGESAFSGCENLEVVKIGKGIEAIGVEAFSGCKYIDTLYCMAKFPPTIKESTFKDINKGITVYIPCGRTSNYEADEYWRKFFNLKEWCSDDDPLEYNNEITITIDGKTYIIEGNTATLKGSNDSGNVVIPSTITDDDGNTYTVTKIDEGAFKNNKNITSITIPESIIEIGCDAFAGCSNLDTVYIESANPPTICNTTFVIGGKKASLTIVVPCGAGDNYKNASIWKDMNIIENCSNIDDIDNYNSILIYPNPATDNITIEGKGEIIIFNNKGQVIRKLDNPNNSVNLDVSDFARGVYYIKVGNITKKLVIE